MRLLYHENSLLKILLYVVGAAWLLGLDGNCLLANSPDAMMPVPKLSFSPVDDEPLGHIPADAMILHDNWQMREEALAGNHGE